MNFPFFDLITLILLFYILSKIADIVIAEMRIVAVKLGFSLGALGGILGLLTTIPEMSVGFNAVALGKPGLSVGNLVGGLIVLFCLVLGVSLVLNRRVETDGRVSGLIPLAVFLLAPLVLGLKGYLGFWDGFLMMASYLFILRYKFIGRVSRMTSVKTFSIENLSIWRWFVYLSIGAFAIVVVSNLIVRVGIDMVEVLNIRPFILGLVFFSLGTNLPEIAIAIRSWRRQVPEISLSALLGSAAANVLVVGWISMLNNIDLPLGPSYYFTLASLAVVISSFVYFYRSGSELTRKEGYLLILLYFVFIAGQAVL